MSWDSKTGSAVERDKSPRAASLVLIESAFHLPAFRLLARQRPLALLGGNHRVRQPDPSIKTRRYRGAHQRRNDKQPQLLQRPAAHENRRPDAARRIHRRVCNWNSHQVNQRQHQSDGQTGKPTGALMSVEPKTVSTKNIVKITSAKKHAAMEYPPGDRNPNPFAPKPRAAAM